MCGLNFYESDDILFPSYFSLEFVDMYLSMRHLTFKSFLKKQLKAGNDQKLLNKD